MNYLAKNCTGHFWASSVPVSQTASRPLENLSRDLQANKKAFPFLVWDWVPSLLRGAWFIRQNNELKICPFYRLRDQLYVNETKETKANENNVNLFPSN